MNSTSRWQRNPRSLSPTDVSLHGTYQPREVCYQCMRPDAHCYCDIVPQVRNKTEIVLLQHQRERVHPFNTARMVRMALKNSRLHVERIKDFTADLLQLSKGAGLLYPGPTSILLNQVGPANLPKQLVVIDGTWFHANRMFRDIQGLRSLPQYRLQPGQPGQYRIRIEPDERSLSTVEAVVAALKTIEPATANLEKLLETFHTMVQRQLDHPAASGRYDQGNAERPQTLNVPKILRGDLSNVVVAYGERAPAAKTARAKEKNDCWPAYWVAVRLKTGQVFAETINGKKGESPKNYEPDFLGHLGLDSSDFENAILPPEFQKRWCRFLRPSDLLVVHHRKSIEMLQAIGVTPGNFELLKSINIDPDNKYRSNADFFAANGIVPELAKVKGRAGIRLANQVTLLRYLNRLA